jgi:parallel beta-helix repeat protein
MNRFFISCLLLFATAASFAAVIHVPADQPTIQAAINAAQNGDTVLVAPGTYYENITFSGKAITVKSTSGNTVTFIDGGHANSVVTFDTGEGLTSVLRGFTVQNGNAGSGGGILISNASPTITGNIVTNNTACGSGAGIQLYFSSAVVQSNTISHNSQSGCTGGGGGGIYVSSGSAQIIGNIIEDNSWVSDEGGGIDLFGAGTPTLKNNIIRSNMAASHGGGITISNYSDALIVQNLIYSNTASQGSGIYFGVPDGYRGPALVNNTIVGTSSSPQGSAVYATGFDNKVQFFNNLMIGTTGTSAVYCDPTYDQNPPTFTNNDAFSPNGSGLQGTCSGQSNTNGNISSDPMFSSISLNFRLRASSPAIDAGDNSAANLPTLDLGNKPRIVEGDNDGNAVIDMGAYEYQPPAR